MSSETTSTRRSVLGFGALLAAPVAVPAVASVATEGLAPCPARGDDEEAVRGLHRDWLRRVNHGDAAVIRPLLDGRMSGRPGSVVQDHAGEPDRIEIAASGRQAAGSFHCAIELEAELPRDCTLGQMAHAQGCGFVRAVRRGVLTVRYSRGRDGWSIDAMTFA